jgi:hypothetical protein
MSEHLEHLDETDLALIGELADLKANDPEGYAAVLEDLGGAEVGADPEKAHADWLLEAIGSKREQEGAVMDLMSEAWASSAEAEKNQQ